MSAFGEAFKAARSAGKKEFTYKGKRYNTRTKDDEAKNSKKNTAAVSKDAAKKIEARAKTPNTETKVTAKAPKAKTPKAKAPKAKTTDSKAGQAYKRMAASKDGVPGRKKKAKKKGIFSRIFGD